ncbi:MAG TPA: hypothetical protein VL993_18640 [Stellaceae bacterium]|nr:hypothetical protein [Stellaceae bacterium]
MWSDRDPPPPRPPKSEPEILPPERADPRRPEPDRVWVAQHRIVFTRPGPLQLVLGFLVLAAVLAVGAFTLLGLFLLSLPVMGAAIIVVIVAALLRGPRRF